MFERMKAWFRRAHDPHCSCPACLVAHERQQLEALADRPDVPPGSRTVDQVRAVRAETDGLVVRCTCQATVTGIDVTGCLLHDEAMRFLFVGSRDARVERALHLIHRSATVDREPPDDAELPERARKYWS